MMYFQNLELPQGPPGLLYSR